ncbi:MAG: hypothetical protein R3D29_10815 [Nitratireductor sp.]
MKPFQSACFVTGAHMDIAARLFDIPVYGSSNPGRLVRQPGGAGLNAASVAASLGLSSSLAGRLVTTHMDRKSAMLQLNAQ